MSRLIRKNGKLICPRCEAEQSILAYTRLQQASKYKDETVPLLKCKLCKFVFGLSDAKI